MKKIFCIIFNLVLNIFASYSIADAHSGGTDASGGHWNRSTGTYHYHHGYSAHQHPNGECPYENSWLLYLLLCLISFAVYILWFLWGIISESLPKNVIFDLEINIHNYKNAKNHIKACNNVLKEIIEKATIPDGYEIGKDGLPKEIESIEWGDSITVYTVLDGWKLHLNRDCCDPYFSYKRNVYSFRNKRYSICKKCAENYQMPDTDWYIEYLKIASQEKKCALAKKEEEKALKLLKASYQKCNTKTSKFFMLFSPSKKKQLNELKKNIIKH